jgi:uncharacterized membrane protein HdeD (DUF308 family)
MKRRGGPTLRPSFDQRSREVSDIYHPPPQATARSADSRMADYAVADHGRGWLLFAGIMLLIVGVMNVIYGIAAIDNSSFYIQDAKYVVSDLNTLGWIVLIVGAVQCFAAFGIWRGGQVGRWVGIVSASCNAILQLIFIASYPFLSLALFAVDVLIIYGLAAYGGRRSA